MSDATITVTVERKLNDDNYGHGSVFLAISGVTLDMTEEELNALIDRQTLVFAKLNASMKGKVRAILKGSESRLDEYDVGAMAARTPPRRDREGESYDSSAAGNEVEL